MSNNKNVVLIHEEEANILHNLSKKINALPSQNSVLFCEQVKHVLHLIPEKIKNIFIDFAKQGSESGSLLIKNLILSDKKLPDTPKNNSFNIGEKTELSRIQAMLTSLMGELVGYEAECFGNLFQDIVPNKSMAQKQTSLGSNVELEIHTEQAFSKLRPDILSLACLRGDENAYTYILPVQSILNNTNEYEHKLLRLPLWKTEVDLSFKLNGHEFIEGDIRGPMPIINGDEFDPLLIFDQDLMTGITKEADELLQKIVKIYYEHRLIYNLKRGDIIFIDNKRAVHGRSSFFPKYDGSDRFLIRCFAKFEYTQTKYARPCNERIFSAIYS